MTDQPAAYTGWKSIAAAIGCGVKRAKRLRRTSGLPVVVIGGRPMLSRTELNGWLDRQNNKQNEKIGNDKSSSKILKLFRNNRRVCYICGFSELVEIHHINPTSKGGTTTEDNLIALCPNCHRLTHHGKYTISELLATKMEVESNEKYILR